MPNITDYLTWRGDLSFIASPWNLIDSLVAANICYNDLNDIAKTKEGALLGELAAVSDLMQRDGNSYFKKWRAFFFAAAKTKRFGNLHIHDYVEIPDASTQFGAMTMEAEGAPTIVAFRGTDANLSGWREDCALSFKIVPAQKFAVYYLNAIAERANKPILCVGHSKGGNLCAYAAAHVSPQAQSMIDGIWNFDGPGLDDNTLASEGYGRIRSRLRSVIPEDSVIGLLLNDYEQYTVVRSTETGILQHDSLSWQLNGLHFDELPQNGTASRLLNQTLDSWLMQCTPEDRQLIVDAVFGLIEPTGAQTTTELSAHFLRTVNTALGSFKNMDPGTRRTLMRLLGRLVATGSGQVVGHFKEKWGTRHHAEGRTKDSAQ